MCCLIGRLIESCLCFIFVKVLAIHSYKAEDADELSFEKGDLIGILPLEDSSDEQVLSEQLLEAICNITWMGGWMG